MSSDVPTTTAVRLQSHPASHITFEYLQNILVQYKIWAPIIYALLYFCVNLFTSDVMINTLAPAFLLPFMFITVLTITAEYLRRTIDAQTRTLKENADTVKGLQDKKKALSEELSAYIQGREEAHSRHRQRINEARLRHYTSLHKHQSSIISFLEYLARSNAKVSLSPELKLPFEQLYIMRIRMQDRLSIAKSIENILHSKTSRALRDEGVDGSIREVEGDLEKAAMVDGYLMHLEDLVKNPAATVRIDPALEERLSGHRERLERYCEGDWRVRNHMRKLDSGEEQG
ncbi:hypothetical protein J4E91_009581 [Alternaria rosae]|nr:hypothetical protein J4E91_009581 [Alternaria rosae]